MKRHVVKRTEYHGCPELSSRTIQRSAVDLGGGWTLYDATEGTPEGYFGGAVGLDEATEYVATGKLPAPRTPLKSLTAVVERVEERERLRLKLKTRNVYDEVAQAVSNGVAAGYRHAHKHTSEPSEDAVVQQVYLDVMNALCEVVDFESRTL